MGNTSTKSPEVPSGANTRESLPDNVESLDPKEAVQAVLANVQATVAREPCVMYSSTDCPYCDKAKDVIAKCNQTCHVVELNKQENMLLASVIQTSTRQNTIPNIFIKGMHVGGFDDLLNALVQCRTPSRLSSNAEMKNFCSFFDKLEVKESPEAAQK